LKKKKKKAKKKKKSIADFGSESLSSIRVRRVQTATLADRFKPPDSEDFRNPGGPRLQ
jgi:hypothetical protein